MQQAVAVGDDLTQLVEVHALLRLLERFAARDSSGGLLVDRFRQSNQKTLTCASSHLTGSWPGTMTPGFNAAQFLEGSRSSRR